MKKGPDGYFDDFTKVFFYLLMIAFKSREIDKNLKIILNTHLKLFKSRFGAIVASE